MKAQVPPAAAAAQRIGEYARRLGRPGDLPGPLLDLLDRTLPLPAGHPAYPANALCPGSYPVEVSFSELDPDALRVDVQPDLRLSPADRLAAAFELARPPAGWSRWRESLAPSRFGAFVGLSVGPVVVGPVVGTPVVVLPDRPTGARWTAYLELDHGASALPEPFAGLVDALRRHVPGLRPHLVSLTGDGAERVYLEAGAGLALLDLFDWAPPSLEPVLPALIDAVRRLTGGCLVLPGGGALLALRPAPAGGPSGVELKVELTRQLLVPDAIDVVQRLLVDRPSAAAGLRRWRRALPPRTEPSVVSVRIAPGCPGPRLNAYAAVLGAVAADGRRSVA
ncbi:hypothetical protein [Nakamurella sp.]|uniref:hypothetical protein n=1 Tax=Nakamurella sp. TaxID=1869182 RepID=UPI0037841056